LVLEDDSIENTDDFGKGMLKEYIGQKGKQTKEAFLAEIVKNYSIETARSKNKSFNYFMVKFVELN
jgi:hypothetical protein